MSAMAVSILVSVAVLGGRAGVGSLVASRPADERVYVVKSGDTVWGIAQRLAGPMADPRPLVDGLISTNHVLNGSIRPGERLLVP